MNKSVLVLSLNFNGINFMPKCIDSIRKQKYDGPIKMCIGDQGSEDGSRELLQKAPKDWFELIEFGQNIGHSIGYNQLIKYSFKELKPDYYFFIDMDTIFFEDAIGTLVKHLELNKIYAIAGLNAYDYKTKEVIKGYGGWIIRNGGMKYWTDGFAGYKKEMDDLDYFSDEYEGGACLMAKGDVVREIWDKYGRWFDPIYAPLYEEDLDICCEVRSMGYEVIHVTKSGFQHYISPTAKKDPQKWWNIHLENKKKFISKWQKRIDEHII